MADKPKFLKDRAKENPHDLGKSDNLLFLGTKATMYIDLNDMTLHIEPRDPVIDERGLKIVIPISQLIKYLPVTWDKEKETFEDVAKKKPKPDLVYDRDGII